LLSGPPGIGKTTSVRIIAKKLGMHVVEWNASDVRNKAAIEAFVGPLRNNQVTNQGRHKNKKGYGLLLILFYKKRRKLFICVLFCFLHSKQVLNLQN